MTTVHHRDVAAAALQVRPGYLEPGELAVVLDYHLGHQLRPAYRRQGTIRADHLLAALATLPASKRHPAAVVEALDWYDRESSLNQPLDAVAARRPLFQPAIERAFRKRRRLYMRHSLREMNGNHRAIAVAANGLLDQLAGSPPGFNRSVHVEHQLQTIQSLIEFGEWHARAACIWAMKIGVATQDISDALVRFYIQPMRRIVELLERLETRLGRTEQWKLSENAAQAARRLALDLMNAAESIPAPGPLR
ncbi:MAG: hypothetical protein WED00_00880 [Aquisalimonadaceae bacterium]